MEYTFDDFQKGMPVKIVSKIVDFHFWYGETGIVTKNTGKYLGIEVKLDKPRIYENGLILEGFNFNPKDLKPLRRQTHKYMSIEDHKKLCPWLNYLNKTSINSSFMVCEDCLLQGEEQGYRHINCNVIVFD